MKNVCVMVLICLSFVSFPLIGSAADDITAKTINITNDDNASLPLQIKQNGNKKLTVTADGRITIGDNVSPYTPIYVKGQTTSGAEISSHQEGNTIPGSGGGGFSAYRTNDDGALPNGGNRLGYIVFGSITGISPKNSAGIISYADGDWDSTQGNYPASLSFQTGISQRTERMVIKADGNVNVITSLTAPTVNADQINSVNVNATGTVDANDVRSSTVNASNTVTAATVNASLIDVVNVKATGAVDANTVSASNNITSPEINATMINAINTISAATIEPGNLFFTEANFIPISLKQECNTGSRGKLVAFRYSDDTDALQICLKTEEGYRWVFVAY